MISLLRITGDINLDNLVKMVSAIFLHCKVTLFPFSYSICQKQIVQPPLKGKGIKLYLWEGRVLKNW